MGATEYLFYVFSALIVALPRLFSATPLVQPRT